MMLCVPAVSVLIVQTAVLPLPEPESATALQPESEEPFSVKLTVPVGFEPVTVAVSATGDPTVLGLGVLASVVVVGVVPPPPPAAMTAAAASTMPAPHKAVVQSLPAGNARADDWILETI